MSFCGLHCNVHSVIIQKIPGGCIFSSSGMLISGSDTHCAHWQVLQQFPNVHTRYSKHHLSQSGKAGSLGGGKTGRVLNKREMVQQVPLFQTMPPRPRMLSTRGVPSFFNA